MADIFISYKREDRVVAERIALAFTELGYSVWWDASLLAGDVFVKEISRQLDEAKVVIVLWSKLALESEWVNTEAAFAWTAKKYVGTTLENDLDLLAVYQSVHHDNLSGFVAHTDGLQGLINSVAQRAPVPDISVEQPVAVQTLLKSEAEAAIWLRIHDSEDDEDFRFYLKQYGEDGKFVKEARARIRDMTPDNAPPLAPGHSEHWERATLADMNSHGRASKKASPYRNIVMSGAAMLVGVLMSWAYTNFEFSKISFLFTSELRQTAAEISALRVQTVRLDREKSALQAQLTALQGQDTDTSGRLEDALEQVVTLEEELALSQAEIATLSEEKQEAVAQIARLTDEKSLLAIRVRTLESVKSLLNQPAQVSPQNVSADYSCKTNDGEDGVRWAQHCWPFDTEEIGYDIGKERREAADLTPLSSLTALRTVYLSGSQATDLSPLSSLTGIQSLYLAGSRVKDLSPLSSMIGLKLLSLHDTYVTDLSALSPLTSLKALALGDTEIEDLSVLSNFNSLTSLCLPVGDCINSDKSAVQAWLDENVRR